jgi:hypothetical protein
MHRDVLIRLNVRLYSKLVGDESIEKILDGTSSTGQQGIVRVLMLEEGAGFDFCNEYTQIADGLRGTCIAERVM